MSGRRCWCVAEEWEYGMMKETLLGREAETEMKKQMERRERAEKQKQKQKQKQEKEKEKEKEERKKRGVWKVRIGYALL